ncbi:unnamed protein product [Sphagnum jensenii]|uniref:Uncharacterized protein n=1 Tax=Sphagnum jensenii TaxID=128206 RepID=A0ABP1B4T5_9BRYO
MCVLTISEDAEGGAADAARTRFICWGSREGHGQIQSSKTRQGTLCPGRIDQKIEFSNSTEEGLCGEDFLAHDADNWDIDALSMTSLVPAHDTGSSPSLQLGNSEDWKHASR